MSNQVHEAEPEEAEHVSGVEHDLVGPADTVDAH